MSQKLKTTYQETIVPKLKEQFGYTNIHQVPKVIKITVNRGLGEASQNAKALESSKEELGWTSQSSPPLKTTKKDAPSSKRWECPLDKSIKRKVNSDR